MIIMADIEKIAVATSNVEAIGYDQQNQILRVWYLTSSIYDYLNVHEIEFESLRQAPSVGAYLARSIKGWYPYQKAG